MPNSLLGDEGEAHKVPIYKEYHSVCPLVGIGLGLSQPLSRHVIVLLLGGSHSPAGEGLGESQFRRLEKKLSTLPTLWKGEAEQ